MGDLVLGHPERLAEIEQAKAQLDHFTRTFTASAQRDDNQYIIPVVFHIIHNNGPENINDEQVYDAVRVMNEDWNKQNSAWPDVQPEFLDRVADMQVTFKLAQLDPQGNCTNGITRTQSTLTTAGNQDMKNLSRWPRDRYLNIWVAASAGGPNTLGYSMYPSSVSGSWGAAADGIVVVHNAVGSIGTANPSFKHTLTHEVGHWLNLKHCWGDSNNPGSPANCNMDDDVEDTPLTQGWQTCNVRGASCGSPLDNVENFMEYTMCEKMFTNGQKARVHAALNSSIASRNNLWSPANLALTGVNLPAELCQVAFKSNLRVVCTGQAVTFSDLSYNGVTEWNWSFPGAEPATSTTASPTVSYSQGGEYNVTLTVGNGTNTMNTTYQEYITVLPGPGVVPPVMEGFENGTDLANTLWSVNDANDGSFQISGATGFNSAQSVRLANNNGRAGLKYELISSTIDNTVDAPLRVSFRYAFAKRNNNNNDALRVYASRDCGETWNMRKAITGASLPTAPNTNASFVPTNTQWEYVELPPIGSLLSVSNLRLKFVFESDGGNNFWLDDININGASTGIASAGTADERAITIVPNPAKDRAAVSAFLGTAGPVRVDLMDLLGRPVRSIDAGSKPAGAARWDLDLAGLPSGMYFVRIDQGGHVQVAKFTKE